MMNHTGDSPRRGSCDVSNSPAKMMLHNRLQARSIIEAMTANRQHADLAFAFTEACDRGGHWGAVIRTSIATFDENFRSSLRTELAKCVTELGSKLADYDLADKPTGASTPHPK